MVALALFLLAGCQVDATVAIDVRPDGSGMVTVRVDLDADAVREAERGGGRLEDRVRLADLAAAGWRVSSWRRDDDDGASIRIRKPFAEPSDLAGVLDELAGDDGPLADVALRVDEGVLYTEYRLSGAADLSALATGIGGDPELTASLTANGVDVAALDQRLVEDLREALRLRVEVGLPGETRTFTPEPGERVKLSASSRRFDPGRSLYLGAAAVLAVAAVALLALPRLRRGGRRRPRRA